MVRFIYASDKYDKDRELVVTNICSILSRLIDLPQNIEVEFSPLRDSVYGETILDTRIKNRIRLNEKLSPKESINPTVHELLHLNQIHLGLLSLRRGGIYTWKGKSYNVDVPNITPEIWAQLPWEIDVAHKQQPILAQIMKIGLAGH